MKSYELSYLISSDLSEEELKIFQEKIASLIENEGGQIKEIKNPIKKKLAYPIKKKIEAFLATLYFSFLGEKLENLEKKLKSESKIIRYLILTKREIEKLRVPKIISKVKAPKVKKEKKVELEKIEEKLEEILGQI